ncbi:copper amine oxidase N-terminal domain-containing protein [Paenibacillus aurantiacus]|uniref:Copper amine oxidase N-terminal domain-containing protein n=1 Tax=Paenibacillus aurantiacus TaxID=1936118 RepID=A0ABV5KJ88_9BACL
MKRFSFALIIAAMMFTIVGMPAAQAASPLPLRVVVNGAKIQFPDAQPFADANQRVQIPIRFVSEALGAKVAWNGTTKKAAISLKTTSLVITIGKRSYTLNGAAKQMDTVALTRNQRTFVPLRFVSEGLGAVVQWDADARTVYINTDGKTPVKEAPSDGNTKEATVHGATFNYQEMGKSIDPTYVTNAQLRISKYENTGEKDQIFMDLAISFTHEDADPAEAMDEAEAILLQKLESKTVEKIMAFVRTKSKREQELNFTTFSDAKYTVYVGSQAYADIGISIANK